MQRKHVTVSATFLSDGILNAPSVPKPLLRIVPSQAQKLFRQVNDAGQSVATVADVHGLLMAPEKPFGKRRDACDNGPNASLAPTPGSSSVGRTPILLNPLSMMLPSRLRTGPLVAVVIRRVEASVSSFCSWQFEQRTFCAPRVLSLKRCAPKSASRLM